MSDPGAAAAPAAAAAPLPALAALAGPSGGGAAAAVARPSALRMAGLTLCGGGPERKALELKTKTA